MVSSTLATFALLQFGLISQAFFLKSTRNTCLNKNYQSRTTLDVIDEVKTNVLNPALRLPWEESGYKSWNWNGYKINYVEAGNSKNPPILLIHGFGASVYHWRYNIPDLAKDHHVFAIDMLGFGLSDKPVIDYSAELWRDQVLEFIETIVKGSRSKIDQMPCVVAGNSLGGFTALFSAASPIAQSRNLIGGCILLNAAGRFRDPNAPPEKEKPAAWIQAITEYIQKLVITASFYYTKQPARIAQVLRQVYIDSTNVDDELVKSIEFASRDPNAAEVFFRVISKNGNGPPLYVDDLLATLKVPLLLLWGEKDPWIRPQAADRIQAMFPAAIRVSVDAGHCPHDESPVAVNEAIRNFMKPTVTFDDSSRLQKTLSIFNILATNNFDMSSATFPRTRDGELMHLISCVGLFGGVWRGAVIASPGCSDSSDSWGVTIGCNSALMDVGLEELPLALDKGILDKHRDQTEKVVRSSKNVNNRLAVQLDYLSSQLFAIVTSNAMANVDLDLTRSTSDMKNL
eukprot:gene802-1561_t